MDVKFAEDRCAWPRRSSESKISRTRSQKVNVISNILDAIAKGNNRDFSGQEKREVVRMKIVVKKEGLKQVLEALRDDNNINENKSQISPSQAAVISLEQRLNFMRKRQIIRKANQLKLKNNSSWMPVLQSIPEEF
ncbi:hypothetical protein RND71_041958 [Anisodus tanguticus]|uniref:Uncharacterized protein n=1 Tax=Anisodus tanguticus TaxID=243964 RepID=A0AAE1UUW6_9SOLA|nr:hypothetical protein RND71_041958 [Anisodus tanguticus]